MLILYFVLLGFSLIDWLCGLMCIKFFVFVLIEFIVISGRDKIRCVILGLEVMLKLFLMISVILKFVLLILLYVILL